ncbi:MAG: hypothetical protein HY721_05000 [Planctomycetes bacterium]|nr:hypothetical protein [Planctomycetota bacterium]
MSERIVLGTGASASYLPRIVPYLESIEANGEGFEAYLVCVGCPEDAPPRVELGRIQPVALARERARGEPGNSCVQHGAFLEVIPGTERDVVVFTDGDMVLQRPASPAELEFLRTLGDGVVGVSYNAGPEDTLLSEAGRLLAQVPLEALTEGVLGGRRQLPVYNTGVIVARRGTYRGLHEAYMARWEEVGGFFRHYARQQWLLSLVLGTGGFRPVVLPYTFHLHGCYALPPGARFDREGYATYEGERVLFRHHL